MKKTITSILILFFLTTCSNFSNQELHSFLLDGSFLVVKEKHDTIQIEFLDNCVKTYTWDYRLYEPWSIEEDGSDLLLYFDGGYYKLDNTDRNELVFTNGEAKFMLIKVKQNAINPDYLLGKWIEARFSYLISETKIPPPPCLQIDTFLMPGVEFKEDSCTLNDFCSIQQRAYKKNLEFGIIRFDEHCTSEHQWIIKKLTKDTLIVNKRYHEENEMRYTENDMYIKFGI